jgi:hypothetical protein
MTAPVCCIVAATRLTIDRRERSGSIASVRNVSLAEVIPPRLTARRGERGIVTVEIAGDWLGRSALPNVGPLQKELDAGGVSALV